MDELQISPRKSSSRRKSSPLGQLLFYLSSVIPAVLLAWYVVSLRTPAPAGGPPQVAQTRPPSGDADPPPRSRPLPSPDSPPTNQTPSPRMPGDDLSPRNSDPPTDQPEATSPPVSDTPRPEKPTTRPKLEQAPSPWESADRLSVDVNFKERPQQVIAMKSRSSPPRCRIVAVKGCDDAFDLEPKTGEFGEEDACAKIMIHSVQDVSIRVHLARKPNNEWVVFVKPTVEVGEEGEIPLTLKRMQKLVADVNREGKLVDQQLAIAEQDFKRFEAALAIPAGRTADVRQLNELGKKEASDRAAALAARLTALEANHEQRTKLLNVAQVINEKCRIEIETAR